MYNTPYKVKEVYDCISVRDYVKNFRIHLSKETGQLIKVNTPEQVQRFSALINNPASTAYKSFKDIGTGVPFWNVQPVVFDQSNLGRDKGYVPYFLCDVCRRRTKYLYFYSEIHPPLCRQCCGFPYRQVNYKERRQRQRMAQIIYRNPMPFPAKPLRDDSID